MDRRVYLGLVGTTAIAGCLGGGGDDSDANGNDTTGENNQTDDSSGDVSDGGNGTAENGDENGDENQNGDTDDDSPVAFELSWDHFVETTNVTSGRNFGADATPDGVFMGAEWGFRGLGLSEGSTLWNKNEWDGFVDIHADTNAVIAYTNSFEVVSIEPQSGDEKWRKTTDSASDTYLASAMAPSYIAVQDGNGVTVFDRATGEAVADVSEDPQVLLLTDTALVISTSMETAIYDLPSGEERLRDQFVLSFGSVVHDGRSVGVGYAESFDAPNQIRAIDLESGEEEWSVSTGESGIGGPTLATEDNVGLFVHGSIGEGSTIHAHDLTDGSELWTDSLGGSTPSFTPPATDSGVAIIPATTENNMAELWAYDVRSGEKLATTSGGLGATEGLAVDRTFLEIGLTDVEAYEF